MSIYFSSLTKRTLSLLTVFVTFLTSIMIFILIGSSPVAHAAGTPVCGFINSNTTWVSANSPYIVTCDVQVAPNVTLTIQPNVVVKFDASNSLIIDGTLDALDCTFTSNIVDPDQGDWGHILFNTFSEDAIYDNSGNYISGSRIQDCLVEWGGDENKANGMIEADHASPFITPSIVRQSQTSGLYLVGRSSTERLFVRDVLINNNGGIHAENGGGLYIMHGEVSSSTISNNESTLGGGIYAINSTLSGNEVSNNEANIGGGVYAIDTMIINNNRIIANQAATGTGSGGGINASGGKIIGNEISGNYARQSGGGIQAENNASIEENIIKSNDTGSLGGGVYINGGQLLNNEIEQNVTDNIGGGVFALAAAISGNTFNNNQAKDGSGVYARSGSNVSKNTLMDNSATQNGTLYIGFESQATQNIVQNNTVGGKGGGIYNIDSSATDNTVTNNEANVGGGIYAVDSTVRGNEVSNNSANSDGGGLYLVDSFGIHNAILGNDVPDWGRGSGAYLLDDVEFNYNDVQNNSAPGGVVGGVSIEGQPTQFQFNNIFDNAPYDAEIVAAGDVDATLNYWGHANCLEIGTQVYDGDDMPNRGELHYAPSLYEPSFMSQMVAPTNLTIMLNDEKSATLSWNPLSKLPDVGCRLPDGKKPDIGYRLYYDNEANCTFDGIDASEGSSPIDLGAKTEVTLTQLVANEIYYFSIVAYDYLGRESNYSNIVFSPESLQFLPLIRSG